MFNPTIEVRVIKCLVKWFACRSSYVRILVFWFNSSVLLCVLISVYIYVVICVYMYACTLSSRNCPLGLVSGPYNLGYLFLYSVAHWVYLGSNWSRKRAVTAHSLRVLAVRSPCFESCGHLLPAKLNTEKWRCSSLFPGLLTATLLTWNPMLICCISIRGANLYS